MRCARSAPIWRWSPGMRISLACSGARSATINWWLRWQPAIRLPAPADIQDMQLLALSADNALQRHLRTHLARAGVHLRMRARVPGIETLCRMLARGVGVAIVPHAALACSSVRQQLVAVPLDEPWARRELSIVWRDTPSAALQALLEWLQASAAQAGIRPP